MWQASAWKMKLKLIKMNNSLLRLCISSKQITDGRRPKNKRIGLKQTRTRFLYSWNRRRDTTSVGRRLWCTRYWRRIGARFKMVTPLGQFCLLQGLDRRWRCRGKEGKHKEHEYKYSTRIHLRMTVTKGCVWLDSKQASVWFGGES